MFPITNRKPRVAVIGNGQIGTAHLNRWKELADVAELVAVCDIKPDVLDRAATNFNVPDKYLAFRDVLKRDDIDAVDVCVHNNLHPGITIAALEAGKHVYCEKPMAGTFCDAKAMRDTARRVGKKLHIQMDTLFAPETRVAKVLIDEGRLGQLYHARSTGFRRRGRPWVDGYGSHFFVQKDVAAGGAMYDMGVYHVCQLLYLMGNPKVARITGQAYQKLPMDKARADSAGYGVEELGAGFVRFEGDLTMDVIEAWAIHLDNFEGSSLVGTDAGLRLQPFGFYQYWGDLEANVNINLGAALGRWRDIRDDGIKFKHSQAHWISALRGEVELLPTAEYALNHMLIAEGIYLSTKLGREVTAEEVSANSKSAALKV
jgi:predicted dehydrogenase